MIAINSHDKIQSFSSDSVTGVRSLLFVCWGNVCRSPAGALIMQKYLRRHNAESFVKVDSAGVCIDEDFKRPSLKMRWATLRRGYLVRHEPRTVCRTDLMRFDLVVAMDYQNLNALYSINRKPTSEIRLLSEFLPSGMPSDVPDPMNRSLHVCDRVLDMIEKACPSIANYMFNYM